jgi:hypothetical protein
MVSAFDLTYDVEVKKNDVTFATFAYDGDGKRVRGVVNGITTAFIGNTYEWTGSASTSIKYYYAATTRIALRMGTGTDGLQYLFGDHLGSTSLSYQVDTSTTQKQLYKAWGEKRYPRGASTLLTKYYWFG